MNIVSFLLLIDVGEFLCLDMPINKPNIVEKVLEIYSQKLQRQFIIFVHVPIRCL